MTLSNLQMRILGPLMYNPTVFTSSLIDSPNDGKSSHRYSLIHVVNLVALALLTIFTWAFLLTIAFRFMFNTVATQSVNLKATWVPLVQEPFFRIPTYIRFKLENVMNYDAHVISVVGLIEFLLGFYATLRNRSAIQWHTIIVALTPDFLVQGLVGAAFFFNQDTVDNKHWFFINVEQPKTYHLFTTLAGLRDLFDHYPSFKAALGEATKDDTSLRVGTHDYSTLTNREKSGDFYIAKE
ncbi:hypothetical protein BJY52DRAFT_1199952 [Lactarius psammicola]|nr:hypothetical protein BJY52DRAFT_1199952 [Lactarius psammicola]